MKYKVSINISLLFALIVPICASADDYKDKDFSLRFPATLSRFSPYSDVAGTASASVASRYGSGFNPASTAWLPPSEVKTSVSPQFSNISFSNGSDLNAYITSSTSKISETDAVTASIAYANSPDSRNNDGLDMDFAISDFALKWGHKNDDNLAIGFIVGYSPQKLDFDFEDIEVVHYRAESYGGKAGILYGVSDKLRIGTMLDFNATLDRTKVLDPSSGIQFDTDDCTYQNIVRSGLAYEYHGHSTLYLDYHAGSMENDTGSLWMHRFPVGVDQQLTEHLWLRGGGLFDTQGEFTPSAGIGIYTSKKFQIDLAFQDNFGPEITKDFGRSRLYSAAISFAF